MVVVVGFRAVRSLEMEDGEGRGVVMGVVWADDAEEVMEVEMRDRRLGGWWVVGAVERSVVADPRLSRSSACGGDSATRPVSGPGNGWSNSNLSLLSRILSASLDPLNRILRFSLVSSAESWSCGLFLGEMSS